MPDTPNFAITYPCEATLLAPADFATYATDVDAAIGTVNAEGVAVTQTPYALQVTNTVVPPGVATNLTNVASPFNFSSGITVGANSFTILTPGMYFTNVESNQIAATVGLQSARMQVLKNGVVFAAFKRKPVVGAPVAPGLGFSIDVPCQAGDVLAWQFLWVGSVVADPLAAAISIQSLSTP